MKRKGQYLSVAFLTVGSGFGLLQGDLARLGPMATLQIGLAIGTACATHIGWMLWKHRGQVHWVWHSGQLHVETGELLQLVAVSSSSGRENLVHRLPENAHNILLQVCRCSPCLGQDGLADYTSHGSMHFTFAHGGKYCASDCLIFAHGSTVCAL
jgi:hypothetical protein